MDASDHRAPPLLAVEGVRYRYPGRTTLSFPDCALAAGEAVALIGPSGSGKTTLLMLLAGLLTTQEGRIEVAGISPGALQGAARDRWRGRTIGMVLQSFQLLPHLSVLENLQAAQYFAGAGSDANAARDTLAALGIAELAPMRPNRLSRGQAQRAAIARAVVNRPKLVLADEPTSSLDDTSAEAALRLLLDESSANGAALLIATHDRRVTSLVPRCISLRQPVLA
jgi:putative ABC transport system ATP-binding protein